MKTVKVTYANGEQITTNINGTDAEILDYFRPGKVFNIGTANDNMQAVVSAEIESQ